MLVGLVAALASACADGPPPTTGPVVTDSGGVRVVEGLASPEPGAGWTVAPTPLFRLGWDDGDPPFQHVSTGAILPDGRVVVGDAGTGELYWIGPDGEVLARAGGPGEGPGEFAGIASILPLGADTVLVQDDGNLRINVFVDGSLAFDDRFEAYFANAIYGVMGRTEGSTLLLRPESLVARALQGQEGWVSYPVVGTDPALLAVDTLVELGVMHMPPADNRNPVRHWGSVDIAGQRIAYAASDRPEVRWFDLEGRLVQVARLDLATVEADEALWDRYEANLRERLEGREPAMVEERVADARRDFEGPQPYFNRAYGDAAGNVWLSEYDITAIEAEAFVVVEADGLSAHRVELPSGIRVLDIVDDRILAVETDELDVQAVVVYAIRKG